MTEKQYIIGVDGGTESLRAGVFDLAGKIPTCQPVTALGLRSQHGYTQQLCPLLGMPAGKPLAFSSCPYTTHFPHPGWAEQNPADWWAAFGTAVQAAVAEAGVAPTSIAAISLDTTNCTVVALDEGKWTQ